MLLHARCVNSFFTYTKSWIEKDAGEGFLTRTQMSTSSSSTAMAFFRPSVPVGSSHLRLSILVLKADPGELLYFR